MAITRRGGRYQAAFTIAGVSDRKAFETREEAVRWELERKLFFLKGHRLPSTSKHREVYLADAFDALFQRVWKDQKSAYTSRLNGRIVVNVMGNIPLSEINAEAVDHCVAALESRDYAPSTINRKLAALSKVLHFARKRGWITEIPAMEKKREPSGRSKYFTQNEEAGILSWFRKNGMQSLADFVEFLVDSGVRHGEGMKLTFSDVAGGNTHVRNSKSDAGARSIPQTRRIRSLIGRRLRDRPAGEVRLFWDLTQNTVCHFWARCRKALGQEADPDWVIHTLRHTFISRLIQKDVNLRTAQMLAGHKSLAVTQRYAHLATNNLRTAIDVLEAA